MRTSQRQTGVTIIELLLALAIALIASTAIFGLFISQSRAMRDTQNTMEVHDNVRVAMDVIARDLRNAGFLTAPNTSASIRIENNCGNSATGSQGGTATPPRLDYSGGYGGTWTVPGSTGTAITNQGDIAKTTQPDGCPNGSDRLVVFYRPRSDYVASNGGPGASSQMDLACPSNSCQPVLDRMGVEGIACGQVGYSTNTVPLCDEDDGLDCYPVIVELRNGMGNSCPCVASTCTVNLHTPGSPLNPFPPSAHSWDALFCDASDGHGCNGKDDTNFNAWVQRTYQLYDLDNDGSTELVYSDDAALLLQGTLGTVPATYVPIASFIDDLQFEVAFKQTPNTFQSINVWNVPSGCTQDATNACMTTRIAANDPPIAVRLTMVARAAKRSVASSGSVRTGATRPQVVDNAPPFDAYVAGAVGPTGPARCYGTLDCGCGATPTTQSYLQCTLRGNAEGYSRRIVSETISLRNLNNL